MVNAAGSIPAGGGIGQIEGMRAKCNMASWAGWVPKIAASSAMGRARKFVALPVDGFPKKSRGYRGQSIGVPVGGPVRNLIAAKDSPYAAPFPTHIRGAEITLIPVVP